MLMTYTFSSVAVLLIVGLLFSFTNMSRSRIGSKAYNNIMLSNNFTADILPPPEYIVESYAAALEYIYTDNQNTRYELYSKMQQYEKKYICQHEFWANNLPDNNELRQVFLVDSYEPAIEFYRVFFKEIVPAVESDNIAKINESKALLQKAYTEHSSSIDKCVLLAENWRNDIYSSSNTTAENNLVLMIIIISSMIIICTVFGLYIYTSEKKLLHMAYYDSLTLLANRKQLTDKMESYINNKKPFYFVIFDLDGFKAINDTFGHLAGDALLQDIA